MQNHDKLFRLIKAMSPAEKRYFTLFAEQHVIGETNNYLLLFKAINRQEKYSEQKLQRKFDKAAFAKRLHVEKVNLYNLILKALRAFHSEHHPDRRIFNLLENVRLLIGMGLYIEADEQLTKAKKLAYDHERFWLLPRLIILERQSIQARFDADTAAEIEKSIAEKDQAMLKLGEELNLRDAYDRVLTAGRHSLNQPELRTDKLLAVAGLDISSADARDPSMGSSRSRLLYLTLVANAARLSGDLPASIRYRYDIVRLRESEEQVFRYERSQHVAALSNLGGLLLRTGNYEEFETILRKLENLKLSTFDEKAEYFQNVIYLRVMYCVNRRQLGDLKKLETDFASDLQKFRTKLNAARHLAILYNLAMLNFVCGDNRKSLDHLLAMEELAPTQHRRDLQLFGLTLKSILHYELGDTGLLTRIIGDARSALAQSKLQHDLEHCILDYSGQLGACRTMSAVAQCFREFQTAIAALRTTPRGGGILGLAEISLWLESKVTRTPIRTIYLERAQRQ